MSRSSPGRYALHEFAKNVFDVHAFDERGAELPIVRPNPHQWNVPQHPARVRVAYKVFGNLVDGTYLGIDASHAHMNMPATLMWARGLDGRPVRVTFAPPEGSSWKPATQLFATDDPWTFTAPNLQYLMDSPTELSNQSFRSFTVRNPDGKRAHDRHRRPSRRDRGRHRRVRRRHREDRPRARCRVRRVSGVRRRHLYVPRRLRAVGRRRRHGASQQHGRRRRGVDQGQRARRARHGVARVLPRLERRAHPSEVARAVFLRRREHVRRALARRGLHAGTTGS